MANLSQGRGRRTEEQRNIKIIDKYIAKCIEEMNIKWHYQEQLENEPEFLVGALTNLCAVKGDIIRRDGKELLSNAKRCTHYGMPTRGDIWKCKLCKEWG